jgi:hypothetical protein
MNSLNIALIQARQVGLEIASAQSANGRLIRTLEAALEAPVKPALRDLSAEQIHRAEHRMSVPSRIDLDAELCAFILERIPRMTYKQVIADVAAHFPPERRTSISAVHRWWREHAPQS